MFTTELELYRTIVAEPKVVSHRLIYADFISESDPGFSEFIHVQCALADPAISQPAQQYLLERQRQLFINDVSLDRFAPWETNPQIVRLAFAYTTSILIYHPNERTFTNSATTVYIRQGFADEIETSYTRFCRFGKLIVERSPITKVTITDAVDNVAVDLKDAYPQLEFTFKWQTAFAASAIPANRRFSAELHQSLDLTHEPYAGLIGQLQALPILLRNVRYHDRPEWRQNMPMESISMSEGFYIARAELLNFRNSDEASNFVESMRLSLIGPFLRRIESNFLTYCPNCDPQDFTLNAIPSSQGNLIGQSVTFDERTRNTRYYYVADCWISRTVPEGQLDSTFPPLS